MKGKNLVIGLVLFIILAIVAIYFAMQVTMDNMENGMAPVMMVVEMIEGTNNQ